jgi:hypothetical protein
MEMLGKQSKAIKILSNPFKTDTSSLKKDAAMENPRLDTTSASCRFHMIIKVTMMAVAGISKKLCTFAQEWENGLLLLAISFPNVLLDMVSSSSSSMT